MHVLSCFDFKDQSLPRLTRVQFAGGNLAIAEEGQINMAIGAVAFGSRFLAHFS